MGKMKIAHKVGTVRYTLESVVVGKSHFLLREKRSRFGYVTSIVATASRAFGANKLTFN